MFKINASILSNLTLTKTRLVKAAKDILHSLQNKFKLNT